ncbi:unnamed protein product, partial [Symbiodinium sp. KB8]
WNTLAAACAQASQWQLCCWLYFRSSSRGVVALSPPLAACEKSSEVVWGCGSFVVGLRIVDLARLGVHGIWIGSLIPEV